LHSLLLLQTLTTHAGLLLLVLESLFSKLDILESELLADDVKITGGVHVALNVNDLGIIEATNNLEDGIDGTNVGQERVSKTRTSGRTASQTGNIIDSQVGGNNRLGLVLLDEPIEPVIGNDDTSFLRVDSGIGEVLDAVSTPILKTADGEGASYSWVTEVRLGNGLEEGRFADVC
jgi:hypothetical protein